MASDRIDGDESAHGVDTDSASAHLMVLRREHRDVDTAIGQLQQAPGHEEMRLKRLKKRRLLLKDAITRLESAQIPDEPA